MYPVRLILKNFGPFEILDYEFQREPIAIIGENRTQDDQASNGSGKSFFNQGLFYGIYGINLRGKEDKRLIRDGQSSAYSCIDIHCPIRKQILRIERELKVKGSSVLKLSIKEDTSEDYAPINVTTVLSGNKYIADWIEISAEDAKSYYIISKGNYKSFFLSSNTEKLALISRFINFSNIDKTKDIVDKKIFQINEEKRVFEKEKSSYEGKLSAYEEQLEEIFQKDYEVERLEQIEKIDSMIEDYRQRVNKSLSSISNYKDKIKESEKSKKEILTLVSEVKKEVDSLDFTSFQSVYTEIESGLKEIASEEEQNQNVRDEIDASIKKFKISLNKIETILGGVIICPKCGHNFVLEEDRSVLEFKTEKSQLQKKIDKNQQKLSEVDEVMAELRAAMKEYTSIRKETEAEENELLSRQNTLLKKLNSLNNDMTQLDNAIERYKMSIEEEETKIQLNKNYVLELKANRKSLEEKPIEKQNTKVLEDKISEIADQIEKKDKEILNKDNEIFKVSQWTQRFKDFKMFLAMEQIKNIQVAANDILKKMGSDLRLMIEGFKKNASGKIVEEITPYIFRDEMELYSFYSGGEKVRSEIALIIALQQAINSTKKYGGLQFLLIDEILESADSLGVENIISSISFMKQPILAVTHVPKLNEEIRQLKIIKENGISRIEN